MARQLFVMLIWLTLLLCASAPVWAQTRTVSGTVTSTEDGMPLPGASVTLIGTSTGTATNAEGEYQIQVPEDGGTLRFSYIGFVSQDVPIGTRSTIDVELSPDYQELSEVVVVGYGSQIQRDITGNIARVSSEDIENLPVNSFESALQGRAAGVVIQNSSGKLGQGIQVRVRGSSSISANNQPLYVIDGIPLTTEDLSSNGAPTNPLAQLNPADIESVEVLKDAAAAAIYGARGSNGVVLITTKGGYSGNTRFTVNYSHSESAPTNKVDFLNAQEYVELYLESARNAGKLEYELGYYDTEQEAVDDWVGYAEGILDYFAQGTDWRNGEVNENWQDAAFQNAYANQFDISARGGDQRTQFYVSGSYSDEKGILFRDEYQRITGRLNLDHQVREGFDIGGNLSLARVHHDRVSNDNAFSNPMQLVAQPPISPIYVPTDSLLPEYRPTGELNPNTLYFNGLLYGGNVRYNTIIYRAIGNAFVNLQVLPGLDFRSEFGVDLLDQNEDEHYNSRVARNTGAQQGLGLNTWNRVVNYTLNSFFTYKPFQSQLHDLETTVGGSFQSATLDEVWVQGEQFPNDDFTQIISAAEITGGESEEEAYRFLSYFARANYKYRDRYLLSVSGRYDGSSRFGQNNQYGFFPAASAGWIISDEPFMQDQELFNFLKLRASYGLTGNAEILFSTAVERNYASLGLWSGIGYGGISGIQPVQTPNPDLQWERTRQLDVGLEWGLFDGRIRGQIDYYRKNTSDLLLLVNVPASTGFEAQMRNVGKLFNEGLEFIVNTDNFRGNTFSWTSSFNVSTNRNEITNLNNQVIEGGDINRAVEGEPIGAFFGLEYAGVDPDNGDALYYVNAQDENGNIIDPEATTNNPNEANRVVIGNPNPDFTGGFRNTFGYKGFELDIFFQFNYGNEIYDGGGRYKTANMLFEDNQLANQMNRWKQPGDQTDVPEARLYYDNGTAASDRYLYDGSYLRLRSVTLAYDVPQRFTRSVNVQGARVYVTGLNLLTFTDYPWWDPEVNTDYLAGNLGLGTEFYSAPQARTISAGVQFTF